MGHHSLVIESAEEFVALRTSNSPYDYRRAARESASDAVWFDVIERFHEMREWVARNKTTSAVVLERLAADPDPSVRYAVAMANRIDVGLLRSLSLDPDETVRSRVAHHKHAPDDLVESLRHDESPVVREAAEAARLRRI